MGMGKALIPMAEWTTSKGRSMMLGKGAEAPQYVDPEIAQINQENAVNSAKVARSLLGDVTTQLGTVKNQFNDLQSQSPEQLANAEIERNRRALSLGQDQMENKINMGVAKRGLGDSAAGLFASLNNQNNYQNKLNDLESSRFGLQRSIFGQNIGLQNALISQQGALAGQIQMPGTQYMTGGSEAKKGILPGVLSAVGGIFGGMFGGPAGAAGGSAAGGAIGGGISQGFQKQGKSLGGYGTY